MQADLHKLFTYFMRDVRSYLTDHPDNAIGEGAPHRAGKAELIFIVIWRFAAEMNELRICEVISTY